MQLTEEEVIKASVWKTNILSSPSIENPKSLTKISVVKLCNNNILILELCVTSLQENRGILMAENVRNSSEQTDSDEFLTNVSVGIFWLEKKIRRNFVRSSDDFLTNTEKRHSDEIPMILRWGHTRPEFIGKTIYRRRRSSDNSDGVHSSVYSDELWASEYIDRHLFVGIFRGILSVGIFRRTVVHRYILTPRIRRNIPILKTN